MLGQHQSRIQRVASTLTGSGIEVSLFLDPDLVREMVREDYAREQAADGALFAERTTFLSPFDSLFWAQGRDQQVWNFDQTLEAYKPRLLLLDPLVREALQKNPGANALVDVTYSFEELCIVVRGTAVHVR